MNRRRSLLSFFAIVLLGVSTAATLAADVLQHVPDDALGFAVVKNMAATDAKIQRLLATLHVNFPAPLAFLTSATGLSHGLNSDGDMLLVALPGEQEPQFAIWLPLQNYDRLLASLDARPGNEITAVVIAGEDILVARHGDWVLLMDPDQRARMEQLLAAKPNPPPAVLEWRTWIDANDAAVVALPKGIRAVLAWVDSRPAPGDDHAQDSDDIFGYRVQDEDPFVAADDNGASSEDGVLVALRAPIRDWLTRSPKLARWLSEAQAIGCAARLDDQGNALAGLRLSGSEQKSAPRAGDEDQELPPTLYQGGRFVLHAAGYAPPALNDIFAEWFVRDAVDDLKNEQRLVVDDEAVARFQQALEKALAAIESTAVVTHPGEKSAGVYTNSFLVVHAESADTFVDRASEVMRLWNTLNRDAEGETPLIFDIEETKLGNRAATQYSLDIASAEGLAIPEVRQAMEKFFGPGGKMQLWIVPVDAQNVLLAAATPSEVEAAIAALGRKQPRDWNRSELAAANALLPARPDWRAFFSPHAYAQWRRRWKDAMTGPVFGARPPKDFPSSPPIGLAGGLRENDLWLDAAIPAETIESADAYVK